MSYLDVDFVMRDCEGTNMGKVYVFKKVSFVHFVYHGMGLIAKTSNLIGAMFYYVHNIARGVEIGD